MSEWNRFVRENSGHGLSMRELSKAYKTRTGKKSRTRRSPVKSRTQKGGNKIKKREIVAQIIQMLPRETARWEIVLELEGLEHREVIVASSNQKGYKTLYGLSDENVDNGYWTVRTFPHSVFDTVSKEWVFFEGTLESLPEDVFNYLGELSDERSIEELHCGGIGRVTSCSFRFKRR